jgi:anti-anti-sigma factor
MALTPSSPPDTHVERGTAVVERGADVTVVWLRGEHDLSTRAALSHIFTRAITFGTTDIVVDLSCVRFLDASTIGVLVAARKLASAGSLALTLRSPSNNARRLLDICGIELVESPPGNRMTPAVALRSWVAVPATRRGDRTAHAAPTGPDPALASVSTLAAAKPPSDRDGARPRAARLVGLLPGRGRT